MIHDSLVFITHYCPFSIFCSVLNCHRQRDLEAPLMCEKISPFGISKCDMAGFKGEPGNIQPIQPIHPGQTARRFLTQIASGLFALGPKGGIRVEFVCRRPEPAIKIIKSIQIIKSPRSFVAGYQNKHRLMVKICHSIPWLYMLFRTVLFLETLWLSHIISNVWPQKWRLFPRLRCCTAPIICIEIWSRRIFFSATVPRQCWSMDHAVAVWRW